MRKSVQNFPTEPNNLTDLVIPEALQKFDDGSFFLLHYSGPGPNRILVFTTQHNLKLLAKSKSVFSDGTFATVPIRLFQQLYTIHAVVLDSVVPLIYALLPNKQGETYNTLFEVIKNLEPQFEPELWMTDFEVAAINGINNNFNEVTVTGCFFHLQQCIWRKIQQLGLTSAYREPNGECATNARSLAALAFVPERDVVQAFTELISDNEFDARLQPLVDYFEDTWIGRPSLSSTRRPPTFQIGLWNVHSRAVNGEHRTNNCIEGWHRRLQSSIDGVHPSVFRCIKALKTEHQRQKKTY